MLFDTPVYFCFLITIVLLYWRLSWRSQNRMLLAASYFFYGWWDWRFLVLMIVSTIVDYSLSRQIASCSNPARRKAMLTLSLVMNFGFLGFFKYCNFFIDSAASLLTTLGVHGVPTTFLQIILPPGISFYTFQEVAYIVDVYHRKLEPADSLLDYGLFISLFPHLIAGPIQRPSHLLPQVQAPRRWNGQAFFDGCVLIVSGLFRKCVIADQCAIIANAGFAGKLGSGLFPLLISVYAFGWQIYGDFSGYSDIARGSAQVLGFHFMVNFRQPYFAESLQDFWRRWHISLSTWLRDYLYIPLGGNRHGTWKTYRNLMATMLLGGLWHGANWTFVIWGGIHGCWLAVERLFSRGGELQFAPRWLSRILVLTVVGLSWVFFRAKTAGEAFGLLSSITLVEWRHEYGVAMLWIGIVSGAMVLIDFRMEHAGEEYAFQGAHLYAPVMTCVTLVGLMVFFAALESNAFIYFQF